MWVIWTENRCNRIPPKRQLDLYHVTLDHILESSNLTYRYCYADPEMRAGSSKNSFSY